MDLQTLLGVLRKRWMAMLTTFLLCICASAIVTLVLPPRYDSTVQFFVSAVSSDNVQLAQGGAFTQQRVTSYAELVTSTRVLRPVAEEIGGVSDLQDLADDISAGAPSSTVLLEAVATADSPERARRIVAAIGTQLPLAVMDLERSESSGKSPVKVTMVREPVADRVPVSPRPVANLLTGAGLGLLLGAAVALLVDRIDNRVRTRKDIESLTGDPVIGAIPFDSETPDSPLSLYTETQSQRAEAYRALRTNLQFIDAATHPHLITVTSSRSGEGKSTTAANLAVAMADSGSSVCLIEGDLRRPRLLRYLGMDGSVGLTDLLIGRVDLDDVLQPFGEHRLAVLGAGAKPPNPSELLGSPAMADLLQQLVGLFDYVLIDAPPLLPVTDGAILGAKSDGVIVVAGSNLVTSDQLQSALSVLEKVDAEVLGIALNRVRRADIPSRYSYGEYTSDLTDEQDQKWQELTAQSEPPTEVLPEPRLVAPAGTAHELPVSPRATRREQPANAGRR